ncbi:hypothetical protein Kpol_242p1 [Vanderwaltozyma polyspora DSM 70294]|uniref:Uncharacterized protein n=1 Tax=Vanderwaltozyma polyspora (strain ATCC 22028 / DSM 70294 / BCRC 21397 / CBS 2163 / NBRC 10782 / NRRL Y-8283 / UCD 57-17) TaxID=436907 RepID=A7TTC1_VANPO|nr:uncharacterized protein Kpol_242p1 [Vanderwaltozyma polyspora DSM 70294]EDO14478.1 hypothetical protein Kpol_242p1 [Vanderwaltozyma polyspora DSM 70294]
MQEKGYRLIRKCPSIKTMAHKEIKTTIYVKSITPYVSALKRITKCLETLDKHGATYVKVLGMGKAIEKTLSLGCHFQENKNRKVDIFTKSIPVLDEVEVEDEDEAKDKDKDENKDGNEEQDSDRETIMKKRTVPGIELHIYP